VRRAAIVLLLAAGTAFGGPVVVSGAFTVDRAPPTPPSLIAPENGADLTGFFVRFSAEAEDALSGVADYDFEVSGAASGWLPNSYLVRRDLRSDTHAWRVRARDKAGNISAWSDNFSFSLLYDRSDDSDNDGVADSWENQYFGSSNFSNGNPDSDGDGVADREEFDAETHPFEFYVDLQRGWNLLAFPFDATVSGTLSLRNVTLGQPWGWTGADWGATPTPDAYDGAWYYAPRASYGVAISGQPVSHKSASVQEGWNLVGSGFKGGVTDASNIAEMYAWGREGYLSIEPAAGSVLFAPLAGYWLRSSSNTVLHFTSIAP
jgi:hypothetical protein